MVIFLTTEGTFFEDIWVQNKATGDENLFGETKKVTRAGWFFVPRHAARVSGRKTTQLSASPCSAGLPTTRVTFFVSKNKFESPIAAFFCNQISSKSNFFNLLSLFFISLNPISLIPIICFKSSVSFLLLDWKVLKYNCCFFCVDT